MRKLQIWGWFITGFIQKHKRLLLLGLFLGVVLSILIIWILPILPKPIRSKRIAVIGQFNKSQLPIEIKSKISQGLTTILEDGSPAPMLAQDWKVSPDGKKYTFVLRDEIFWQDGTKIVTDDINYNFTDVNIEKPNSNTIIFNLKSLKG